ncbi:MAG TPA: ABC transporter substrate-binding protein [Arachnia sp.]|nr:ABC transporter substrate-binding protein [Arachnia sp.]
MNRKPLKFALGLSAVALLATGCLGGGSETPGTTDPGDATAKTTIELMYAFSGDQSVAFQDDMKEWGEANGITFDFIQSNEFEVQIVSKVQSGNAPDIAIFPQPGILQSMASDGQLAELGTQVDLAKLQADVIPGFLDAATVDGKIYGAPMAMNGKSFYWYNKPAFEAKGYTVPTTHEELLALVDKIKADGTAPFCYGMESGSATGWPATDWIEDYVLQTGGADVYDKWVKGEIKFDSPEVREAFAIYEELLMTDGNVYGGIKNASSNAFAQALNPMFDDEPKCYLGKQGNFVTQKGFFPDDIFAELDTVVGQFQTPTVKGEEPFLGGGDLAAAMTANDDNVKKVMAYMTTDPEFGKRQAQTGAWLSPLKTFDVANYPNETLRTVAGAISGASLFRFDGSDQMPGAVGSGAFWTGMVDFTSGRSDLDTTLKTIDAAWPVD